MAVILHIETASPVCSAALSRDGELIDIRETNDPRSHASRLSPYIDELMATSGIAFASLDAVSVSLGPGSYTGLRIGVSTAKGIAYAMDIPIIGVSSLQALANRFTADYSSLLRENHNSKILLCPMLDARRMEVYSAFYSPSLEIIREVNADIIEKDSYRELLEKAKVFFFGSGSVKCMEIIQHPNAEFIPDIELSSRFMISLAESSWEKKDFVDMAYFEPFYLKDFIATVPKNKIIPPQNQG